MLRFLAKTHLLLTLTISSATFAQSQEDSLGLLEIAIASLKDNVWLDTVTINARITLNNSMKDTVVHQPGSTYVVFNNTGIQSVVKRMGEYKYSQEHYLGDNADSVLDSSSFEAPGLFGTAGTFSYDVYDTEKNVSYDGRKEVSFLESFRRRHHSSNFFNIKRLEDNHTLGGFVGGLAEYKSRVENGDYVLAMDVRDDAWTARFSWPGDAEVFAEVVFDPRKSFNITKYVYNHPARTVGYSETRYEYELQNGEWVLASVTRQGENENIIRNFALTVISIEVGEAAGLSEEDFDWRQLPIPSNTQITDYRFPERIVYDYTPALPSFNLNAIRDLLSEDVTPGTLARLDPDTQEILVLESSDTVLPQLAALDTASGPSPNRWLRYSALFVATLILLLGARVLKKRFFILLVGSTLLFSITENCPALETVEDLVLEGVLTNINGLCGINCVNAILTDQNIIFEVEELKRSLDWNGYGTSMESMLRFFQERRWYTKTIEVKFIELINILKKNKDSYAIVHLGAGERHWVVVRAKNSNIYEVIDRPFKLSFYTDDLDEWGNATVKVLLVSPEKLKEPSILSIEPVMAILLAGAIAFLLPIRRKH